MWEMASFCSYEENSDMEQLGEKLMCTTLELEKLKAEAVDEIKRNKEYIKQLIHLLKYAIQERDQARDQFQKLLTNTMPTTAAAFPQFHSGSPLLKSAMQPNSSITESNSISADSLFDAAVSSADFSAAATNQPPLVDRAALVVDNLAKGRVLPQKGEFLQAVLRAGPLLQTLLVAGPLPTWRNPPQLQPLQMPHFSIKGCESSDHKPYAQLSCGSAQFQTSPMLSFANLASASSMMNGNDGYAPFPKRQRFS